jgi:phosphoglycolate phosphatase-like HAD superfamily hydrolase
VIRRLLLFDVDGTLVGTGEVGAAIFDAALESVVGRRPTVRVRMSGKTDPQIVAEYLHQMGLAGGSDLVGAVLDVAAQELATAAARGEVAAGASVCPGVETLLSVLAGDPRVVSTLVTGNIAPNALIKVGAFGLDRWLDLSIGAYGSDAADRNLLVPIALGRLRAVRGVRLEPPDAWVIGDTPRDLECARAAGVRCLLVATGRYDLTALRSLGADAVLPDLRDTDAVVSLLTGNLSERP